jgi:hypothetical protein
MKNKGFGSGLIKSWFEIQEWEVSGTMSPRALHLPRAIVLESMQLPGGDQHTGRGLAWISTSTGHRRGRSRSGLAHNHVNLGN